MRKVYKSWFVYLLFMSYNGPETVEGWMEFLEDEDCVWFEAFEINDDGKLDMDHYSEFDSRMELIDFVAGTGEYSDCNSFAPTDEDLSRRKRELHNDRWKVPSRVEELERYLEDGALYNEVDIDPSASAGWSVSERDARMDGVDTKYTAHFVAYDEDARNGEGASVYYSVSWFDEDAADLDLMELFELEDLK